MAIAPLTRPQKGTPLLFEGLTWREYKTVEQLLERPGYRLSFLDGVLEIVQVPGEAHETVKERIGSLLEIYLLLAGFDFTPTGSMTLESASGQVKREADKSYRLRPGKSRPDLVIEVAFSSGGISKLEAYKRLKISEVWFWEDGELDLYHLRDKGTQLKYERIDQSEEVQGLDLALLQRCIEIENHVEAVRTWQQG